MGRRRRETPEDSEQEGEGKEEEEEKEGEQQLAAAAFVPPSIDAARIVSGESYSHYSPMPDALVKAPATECVLGIDEAGRGPVLGPMVYAGFYLPRPLHRALLTNAAHRFDDSKALTPLARARLMRRLCTPRTALHDACGWAVTLLSARDVSAGMLKGSSGSSSGGGGGGGGDGDGGGGTSTARGKRGGKSSAAASAAATASAASSYNLNAQATDATIALVRGVLARGVNVRELLVDTIGAPHAHQARLARALPGIAVITVAKKADALFPCVSAASVCAKVTRDAALEACYAAYVASVAASASSAAVHRRSSLLLSSSSSATQTAASETAANDHADDDNNDDGDGKDGDVAMNDDGGSNNPSSDQDNDAAASWGSGYPSDARCSRWLRRTMDPVFGWGSECRFSWSTARDMLESAGAGVRVDWHAANNNSNTADDTAAAEAALENYFAASTRTAGGDDDGGMLSGSARTDRRRRHEMDGWFGAPLAESIF